MDRGSWQATVHGGLKKLDTTEHSQEEPHIQRRKSLFNTDHASEKTAVWQPQPHGRSYFYHSAPIISIFS